MGNFPIVQGTGVLAFMRSEGLGSDACACCPGSHVFCRYFMGLPDFNDLTQDLRQRNDLEGREFRVTVELVAEPPKYDDTLLPFLALMRKELHANSHKGDREAWLRMSLEQALTEIRHHADKLIVPVMNHDREAIREHAADVANCAMMLADIAGVLSRE